MSAHDELKKKGHGAQGCGGEHDRLADKFGLLAESVHKVLLSLPYNLADRMKAVIPPGKFTKLYTSD
jgi:hypothetical protein